MYPRLIVLGALHLTFIIWYLGSSGVISQWPITTLWSMLLLLYLCKEIVLPSSFKPAIVLIKDDWIFLAFIFFVGGRIISDFLFKGDQIDYNGASLFEFNANVLYLMVMYYLLGRFCFDYALKNMRVITIGFSILFACVMLNIDHGLGRIKMDFLDERKMGLYLILGDIFSLVAIAAFCSVKRNDAKVAISLFSLVALFYLNSRASLYVSLLVYVSYFSFIKLTNVIKYGFFFLATLLLILFIYGDSAIESNERMFFGFGNAGEDLSLAGRNEMMDLGLDHILSNVIFGNYGGVIQDVGVIGAYIHNAMSYWQQFGLFAFVIFVYLTLSNFISLFKLALSNRDVFSRVDCQFVILGGFFSVLMVVFARSYAWYLVWLFIGYSASVRELLYSAARIRSSQ